MLTDTEVAELDAAIEAIDDLNPVGACLHIVLDDGNLSDGNIAFCREFHLTADDWACKEEPRLIAFVEKAGDLLARASLQQRVEAVGHGDAG